MKHVRNYIAARQSIFANGKFFQRLDAGSSPRDALSVVSGLTFFVLVFQDVLRLNEARVTDPVLKMIARHHRAEDSRHDDWFLHDLELVEGRLPDVREAFSEGHQATRDTAYTIISEALGATDDRVSIAILLVLESTGHVFFDRVVSHLERTGSTLDLWYFGRGHLDVELSHELFENKMNATLDAIELTEAERALVIESVDRCFDAIGKMLDVLAEGARTMPPKTMTAPPPSRVRLREGAKRPSLADLEAEIGEEALLENVG